MIPWCTSFYEVESAKGMAKGLRESGRYSKVKLGAYLYEDGKRYCRIYVELEEGYHEQLCGKQRSH